MGIQIRARPDSGFDDPIGMLVDCHKRIEQFTLTLCILPESARGRTLTDEEREAVEASFHYFRVGVDRHNADEEDSLFPRLLGVCSREIADELNRLEEDHQRIHALHTSLEAIYWDWIAAGRLNAKDQVRLIEATGQLKRLHDDHIRREEQTVFPCAAEILDAETIAAMGEEFRQRRKE